MVDYNNFAKTFSDSRKNLKWEEISYFLWQIDNINWKKIIDIWCGNWRFLWELINKYNLIKDDYLWIDLSDGLLDEAKKLYEWYDFLELDMLDLNKLWENNKYDYIFFIASYHHLYSLEERIKVLKYSYDLLKKWGLIFMTNWALNSELNNEKYKNSQIFWSKNKFWSMDYEIKIWTSSRFYHCFEISELEYLFFKQWFQIIKNRLFENDKNYVSIIKK